MFGSDTSDGSQGGQDGSKSKTKKVATGAVNKGGRPTGSKTNKAAANGGTRKIQRQAEVVGPKKPEKLPVCCNLLIANHCFDIVLAGFVHGC